MEKSELLYIINTMIDICNYENCIVNIMSQITEEYRNALANYARECLFEQIYCSHYLLLKNIDVNFYIEKLAERFFQKTGKSFPNSLYDEIYACFSGMYLTAKTDALYKRIDALFLKFDKKNQIKVMKKVKLTKKVDSLNSLSDSAKLYIERKSQSISNEKYEQFKLEAIAQNAKDVIQFQKNCRKYKSEVFNYEIIYLESDENE